MSNQYILAMSGNDIFSGGGLYADLATYTSRGLHGFVAVTCLTAMTAKGFEVFATETPIFQAQLDSLKAVPFSGIKLGLLPNPEVAAAALAFIQDRPNIPVVLDPVLVCKESHDVEVSALRNELLKFLPYATVTTPNLVEAELLTGQSIQTLDDMRAAAQSLYDLGARQVVIKGGKRFSQEVALDLYYDGQTFEVLEAPILSQNNIGAGCTFASSIASYLVAGASPLEAVKQAKSFVHAAIQKADDYGVKQYD